MEQQAPSKGLSIAGLVLGAVAICLFYVPVWNWIGLVCGIVGLILSILGRKKFAAAGLKSGLATAALIVSIIGLILSAIGVIACTICVACANKAVSDINSSDLQELEDWANSLQ